MEHFYISEKVFDWKAWVEAFSFTESNAVWTSLEQFQGKLVHSDSSSPMVLHQVKDLQRSGLYPGM